MGTRCLTVVMDEGKEVMTMYQQYDGYPSGHGGALKNFLADFQICNGIGKEEETGKWANGMGCLAAQIVANFKEGIGNIYLMPCGTRDVWEEYVYTLTESADHKIDMVVLDVNSKKEIYSGPIKDFEAQP